MNIVDKNGAYTPSAKAAAEEIRLFAKHMMRKYAGKFNANNVLLLFIQEAYTEMCYFNVLGKRRYLKETKGTKQ